MKRDGSLVNVVFESERILYVQPSFDLIPDYPDYDESVIKAQIPPDIPMPKKRGRKPKNP